MTTEERPDTFFLIVPATGDLHDRTYQFCKPLTYLSDRQHARLLIMRSRVNETPAAQQAIDL